MSANTGASELYAQSNRLKPIVIDSFKTFEFYKDPKLLISAKVCKIGGKPFIGIDKFWFDHNTKTWLPSRKGHIYQTPDQWRAFAQCVPAITQALRGMENKMYNVASSGMHTAGLLPQRVYVHLM